MKLLSTSIFSSIITIIKIVSGFIASKVVTMYAGAAGIALVGSLTNFINISLTFATGSISTGVIKYTAEYKNDNNKLKDLFSTSLIITLISSILTGLILVSFGKTFSDLVFSSNNFVTLIRVFGTTIIFYALNSLFISILNGLGEIRDYAIVNTAGSIVGLIFTLVLVYYFKLEGALYALILAQAIVFFITVSKLYKSRWFNIDYFKWEYNSFIAAKLSHYSLMTIVSAITSPFVQIILRNFIISSFGVSSAGYWQGLMRISDGYLMLITTALGTYYLPKLSSINSKEDLRSEILLGYKIITPIVIISSLSIYFFRFQIISLLYSTAFWPMEKLFFWQLVGDFFKITSWLLSYLLIAKAMISAFIIIEIIFSSTYLILSFYFMEKYQIEGVVIAFAVNYFIYSIVLIFIFWKGILSYK